MQNRKPHSQKAPQTGHSIFGTILFSLLAVLAVEILLLTFAVHATRLGPQLNQISLPCRWTTAAGIFSPSSTMHRS